MKYTPGPWRIDEQDIFSGYEFICTWSGRSSNANLIASAPELLEACKLMLIEHQRVNEQFGQSLNDNTPGMALAIKALAKAEGKP
jgi:hypothetical protein